MGSASSTNTIDLTEQVMSKTVSDIVSNQSASSSQAQIISVAGGTGPVDISHNSQNQQVAVNMTGVAKQMSKIQTQQKIAQQLSQIAASSVSGINLDNNSKSNNAINDYLNVSMNVASNLSQICEAKNNQVQAITVNFQDGAVKIDDNQQKQVGNVVAKCIQDASSTNKSLQDVSTTLDQSAKSKTVGIDIWAIIILILVGVFAVFAPVVIPVVVGANVIENGIVKFIGPLFILGGIAAIIVGSVPSIGIYQSPKPITPFIQGMQFSTLIKNDPTCAGTSYTPKSPPSSNPDPLASAAATCLADNDCKGLDWDTSTKPPTVTFYNKLAQPSCPNVKTQDLSVSNIALVKDAVVTVDTTMAAGSLPPNTVGNYGDVYILNSSGKAFWRVTKAGDTTDNAWQDIGQVPGAETNWTPGTIRAQTSGPTDSVGNDNDIWIDITDPLKWEVWQRVKGKYTAPTADAGSLGPNNGAIWTPGYATSNLLSFPGRHGNAQPPATYNWSGYKLTTSGQVNNTMAYLFIGCGVASIIFGIFMTYQSFIKPKSSPPGANPSANPGAKSGTSTPPTVK